MIYLFRSDRYSLYQNESNWSDTLNLTKSFRTISRVINSFLMRLRTLVRSANADASWDARYGLCLPSHLALICMLWSCLCCPPYCCVFLAIKWQVVFNWWWILVCSSRKSYFGHHVVIWSKLLIWFLQICNHA